MLRFSIILYLFLQISFNPSLKITINPDKDKEVKFRLTDFTEDVKYIKLETKDECVLSGITKLLIDGDSLFLSTQSGLNTRLMIFTSKGNFVKEIAKYGRGPGEFASILDFALDKTNKLVYILDSMGKILLYDYSGNYVRTISLESRPSNLLISGEAIYLFSAWPDYYLNKGYAIEIKPLNGTKNEIYLINRKQIKYQRQQGVIIYPNYLYGIKNKSVSFFEAKFDTLYNIDSNYKIKPVLVLDLINKIPRDLLTSSDYYTAMKTHNTYSNFIEAGDFIFFKVITSKLDTYFYLLNKTTKQLMKHNVTNDNEYIFNDIDGGLSFKPKGIVSDKLLYSYFDCSLLQDHFAKKSPVTNKNIVQKKNEELKKLISNSNFSDNPIIMLVKLR